MRKRTIICRLGLIALLASTALFSCNKKEPAKETESNLDLVNDIAPRVVPNTDIIHLVNDQLHHAKDMVEMKKIMDDNPWVAPRIVTFARDLAIISPSTKVDSVVFCWGSQKAQAQDKTGKWFNGKFADQLVAFIFHDGQKKPAGVLVTCTNGVITSLENLNRIGTQGIEFTIEKGKGINSYVDYQTSITLAEHFDLDLYKGREMTERNKITPAQARELESKVKDVQVTVKVFAGDHFNLRNMTYSHAQ